MTDTVELFWIDPGSTTGVSLVRVETRWLHGKGDAGFEYLGGSIVERFRYEFGRRYGQSEIEICELIHMHTKRYDEAAIGIEGFKAKAAAGGLSHEALSPVRITFGIDVLEQVRGYGRDILTQPVSMATDTVSPEQCREAGMWWPGHKDYNMAARHALTFLRRARVNEKLRHQAWPERF